MKTIITKKYAQLKDANILKSVIQSYIDFIQQFPVCEWEEECENNMMVAYFEQMIEGIDIETVMYDKLVEKSFGSTDRDIIRHLQSLEPIPNGTNEEKANFIKNVYKTYFDSNHVVRGNLFFMDAIAEVREWLDKNSKFGKRY